MNRIRKGYSECTHCNKTFKWIGYASVRTKLSDPHSEVIAYTIPDRQPDEMLIDYSEAKNGFVEWYCPLCGYITKVNIDDYEN